MRLCPACGQRIRGRARTTGKWSQSAHLHGHLQQLGKELGYSLGEMKAVMKEDCVDWPRKPVAFHGKSYMVPLSESELDTVEESAAIEWTHMRAAELSITLREE